MARPTYDARTKRKPLMPGVGAAITTIQRVPVQSLAQRYTDALKRGRKLWHPGSQLPPWHAQAQQIVAYHLQVRPKAQPAESRERKLKLRK